MYIHTEREDMTEAERNELNAAYERIEQLHRHIEYLIRQTDWSEKRMDIIGQNGPTGEHYTGSFK